MQPASLGFRSESSFRRVGAAAKLAIFWEAVSVKYAYFPGCSLECNAAAYDHSVREVADMLDIKLQEIDDWNCCGATEYFSQDELTACAP